MYLPSPMRLSLLGSGFPAGNVPSGTALIMFDLRGNSPKAWGARVEVAPQKQSAATLVSFSMLMESASISTYASIASTSSVAPTVSHWAQSYDSSIRTFSVASCSLIVRLIPSLLNTLSPLLGRVVAGCYLYACVRSRLPYHPRRHGRGNQAHLDDICPGRVEP